MKDYRQVFRFCVIKGTATIGENSSDWRINEDEEAFQSREKATKAFDSAQKAMIPIAEAMGTKARKEEGIVWFLEESTGTTLFHYLRYEEIPLVKQGMEHKKEEDDPFGFIPLKPSLSPVEERILETGTCSLGKNVRSERREVLPSHDGGDEYTVDGSPKNPDHPMTFTRQRSTATYSEIRLTLEKARSTVFFGELYPDELDDELRKRAVKLESPRKLYSVVKKAFRDQGVRKCSLLISSDWLRSEYEEWCHSLSWEPDNEDLPDYLSDYLNYRFLKDEGLIDEKMTLNRYLRLRELRSVWYDDNDEMEPSAAALPDPFVFGVDLEGTWDDSFPLLLKVYFNFEAEDVPADRARAVQDANEELADAYLSYKQCERLD